MNELQIVLTEENGESKITSVNLCELINMFRKEEGNNTEKRHDVLLRDIRNEISTLLNANLGVHNFVESSYTNSQNKQQPCFLLNNEGVFQMLMKESATVRYKTVEYIKKLQQQVNKPSLPKTYKEALIELLAQVEENEKLQLENQEQRNKIEVMKPSVNMAQKRRASDGLYTYTDCQKLLGLKQGNIGCYLKIKGLVHWDKKETTKLGDDTGFVKQYGEEFPNIGITELGLKYLEDNLEELKKSPCKLPKKKQDWLDMQ